LAVATMSCGQNPLRGNETTTADLTTAHKESDLPRPGVGQTGHSADDLVALLVQNGLHRRLAAAAWFHAVGLIDTIGAIRCFVAPLATSQADIRMVRARTDSLWAFGNFGVDHIATSVD